MSNSTTARTSAPATQIGALGALAVLAVIVGASLPDVTGDAGSMTHYMGLLSANQPWNLIAFMAIPVILAEILAVTELAILFNQGKVAAWIRQLNRGAGLIAGPWFLGIFVYLLKNAVYPLTMHGGWHGPADVIAVLAYLLGVVPLVGITLLEFRVIGGDNPTAQMRLHAKFVGLFLIVAHVAMIFGMLDPSLLGWMATASGSMGM